MHEITIHVYPTDCDMLGHVNHATMITFFEHARWAMLEPEMTVHDWFKAGVWPVVRHMDVSYRAQAVPGDDLRVRSGLLGTGNTSFSLRQEVRRQVDARLVAEATITFVCIDRGGQPVTVPAEWTALFSTWRDEP
jgi:YbgC/YbaW family acyl-CoA thioester hydrolase